MKIHKSEYTKKKTLKSIKNDFKYGKPTLACAISRCSPPSASFYATTL